MILKQLFKTNKYIPVLCYHSMRVDGPDYSNNDHIALESDLATLHERGYRPISLADVAAFAEGKKRFKPSDKVFALTFDDAPILDYDSYQHPHLGAIKSFRAILLESKLYHSPNTNYNTRHSQSSSAS